MHIPNSVAWGGPGKKWIKINDVWRECTDCTIEDAFLERNKRTHKSVEVNPSRTGDENDHGKITVHSNFEQGMWIRVAPKSSREVAGYDSLGSFLQKLHLSNSGEKLGPFNYMLPMMELIIKWQLPQLTRSAKRLLFDVIDDMVARVLHTSEYIHEIKSLLQIFQRQVEDLDSCFVSPTELIRDLERIKTWIEKLDAYTVPQRRDDGISLIDMPLEVLQLIVSFVDKYQDVESLSNVNDALRDLCNEEEQWKLRCYRHFSESNIVESMQLAKKSGAEGKPSWHEIYAQATNNFTRKDPEERCMLHCKTCGLMFWKGYGHPCIRDSSAMYEAVSPEKLLYYFS